MRVPFPSLTRVSLVLAVIAAMAGNAKAVPYTFIPIEQSERPSLRPVVEWSPGEPGGTLLVVWEEADSGRPDPSLREPNEIRARAARGGVLLPALTLGHGRAPCVCRAGSEFIVAWISGRNLMVRSGDGGSWSEPRALDAGGEVAGADLAANPEEDEIWLAWQQGTWLRLATRSAGSWQPAQDIARTEFGTACPQVLPTRVADTVRPRVYYFRGQSEELAYREYDGTSWVPGSALGDRYGSMARAASGPDLRHVVLTLLSQPRCPCNRLFFLREQDHGVWSSPQELTVHGATFDWPRDQAVGVDAEGRAHAVWYQSFHDDSLGAAGQGMFYKTEDGGTWPDRSGLLEGRIGTGCDLAIGGDGLPAIVWVDPSAGRGDIVLAVPGSGPLPAGSGMLQASALGLEPPITELQVAAIPNPSRGAVRLSFRAPEGVPVSLAIFDPAGRRVAFFAEAGKQAVRSGGTAGIHWDGRDQAGVPVPGGVYQIRLAAGTISKTTRFVLLR